MVFAPGPVSMPEPQRTVLAAKLGVAPAPVLAEPVLDSAFSEQAFLVKRHSVLPTCCLTKTCMRRTSGGKYPPIASSCPLAGNGRYGTAETDTRDVEVPPRPMLWHSSRGRAGVRGGNVPRDRLGRHRALVNRRWEAVIKAIQRKVRLVAGACPADRATAGDLVLVSWCNLREFLRLRSGRFLVIGNLCWWTKLPQLPVEGPLHRFCPALVHS
jgi:hypothetical protein